MHIVGCDDSRVIILCVDQNKINFQLAEVVLPFDLILIEDIGR